LLFFLDLFLNFLLLRFRFLLFHVLCWFCVHDRHTDVLHRSFIELESVANVDLLDLALAEDVEGAWPLKGADDHYSVADRFASYIQVCCGVAVDSQCPGWG
jgi:hypothetical protein